jgi:hypothetical protein
MLLLAMSWWCGGSVEHVIAHEDPSGASRGYDTHHMATSTTRSQAAHHVVTHEAPSMLGAMRLRPKHTPCMTCQRGLLRSVLCKHQAVQ